MGYCAECGRVFPTSELVAIGAVTICASCKPIHLQRLRERVQQLEGSGLASEPLSASLQRIMEDIDYQI